MALTDATLNSMGDHLASLAPFVSLHTADPGTTGANEVTGGGYARQGVTWDAATSGGDISLTGSETFSGPASSAVTHIGLQSASTAGTFRGGYALTGDQSFNAAGSYTLTDITLNGANA